MYAWWCMVLCAAGAGAGAGARGLAAGGRAWYEVETTLVVSELGEEHKHRDVGYRVRGSLALHAAACAESESESDEHPPLLLRFRLQSAELALRGAHPRAEYVRRASPWDAAAGAEWAALWRRGTLARAFLDPAAPPDLRHYQLALTSLFQFQVRDGEYNETDVSGECRVSYETVSPTVFRKIKRRCSWEAEEEGEGVRARRVSRYTLSEARDAVVALHAEEVVWVQAAAGDGDGGALGLKARSWTTLARREPPAGAPPAPAPAARSLEEALAALPASLAPAALPLPPPPPDADDHQTLEEAVRSHRAALEGDEAGGGGTVRAAEALVPLLRALRAASAPELRALLDRPDLQDVLPGLCRALGLAGSVAAWDAARGLLAPHAHDALQPLALHYLAGLTLSAAPQEEVVRGVLALGGEAREPAVREAAWLAGAAAAGCAPGDALREHARELLGAALARCGADAACRAARVRALGNLREPRAAPALLASALHRPGREAAAALRALRALPAAALAPPHLERLGALATNSSRALGERALALEAVTQARCARRAEGVVPLQLVRVARALRDERSADAHELRRALWQRLDSLADRAAVRALRRVLPRDLATWDARAHAGTSSVLRREAGWAGARAALDSVQVAARGLLRHGAVTLLAGDTELLQVEVTTQGLEALTGGGGAGGEGGEGEGGEGETPAAELQTSAGGAALPAVRLFSGQAELVGHIWAGRGAAPAAAARALAERAWRATVPLQAGAALQARAEGGGALALDASADVSLWYRTARARLALRAAGLARATLAVRTAAAELRAEVRAHAEPRLRIHADLDFYERLALCVRAAVPDHHFRRWARLESLGGAEGRRLRVRREREAAWGRAGRTLALGRDADAACRLLRAADSPDDDRL